MKGWTTGYLLLGSNLGDRWKQIDHALSSFPAETIRIKEQSGLYETAAWGIPDQPAFLNQVIGIQTALSPLALLDICQQIEAAAGPRKARHWGERHLDIDVLYYGHRIIRHRQLVVPHPYLAERRFTLEPLAEIAPEWLHPEYSVSNRELLERCIDTLPVEKWTGHAS